MVTSQTDGGMDKRACRTYLRVVCESDCAGLESELAAFGCAVERKGNKLAVGVNERFDVDVNRMLRITLKGLIGMEAQLKALTQKYCARMYLTIVPYLVAESDRPNQCLSPEKDIIEFLYLSGAELDLDYYII